MEDDSDSDSASENEETLKAMRAAVRKGVEDWNQRIKEADVWKSKFERANTQLGKMREEFLKEVTMLKQQLYEKEKAQANGTAFSPHDVGFISRSGQDATTSELQGKLLQAHEQCQEHEREASNLRDRNHALAEQLATTKLLLERKVKLIEKMSASSLTTGQVLIDQDATDFCRAVSVGGDAMGNPLKEDLLPVSQDIHPRTHAEGTSAAQSDAELAQPARAQAPPKAAPRRRPQNPTNLMTASRTMREGATSLARALVHQCVGTSPYDMMPRTECHSSACQTVLDQRAMIEAFSTLEAKIEDNWQNLLGREEEDEEEEEEVRTATTEGPSRAAELGGEAARNTTTTAVPAALCRLAAQKAHPRRTPYVERRRASLTTAALAQCQAEPEPEAEEGRPSFIEVCRPAPVAPVRCERCQALVSIPGAQSDVRLVAPSTPDRARVTERLGFKDQLEQLEAFAKELEAHLPELRQRAEAASRQSPAAFGPGVRERALLERLSRFAAGPLEPAQDIAAAVLLKPKDPTTLDTVVAALGAKWKDRSAGTVATQAVQSARLSHQGFSRNRLVGPVVELLQKHGVNVVEQEPTPLQAPTPSPRNRLSHNGRPTLVPVAGSMTSVASTASAAGGEVNRSSSSGLGTLDRKRLGAAAAEEDTDGCSPTRVVPSRLSKSQGGPPAARPKAGSGCGVLTDSSTSWPDGKHMERRPTLRTADNIRGDSGFSSNLTEGQGESKDSSGFWSDGKRGSMEWQQTPRGGIRGDSGLRAELPEDLAGDPDLLLVQATGFKGRSFFKRMGELPPCSLSPPGSGRVVSEDLAANAMTQLSSTPTMTLTQTSFSRQISSEVEQLGAKVMAELPVLARHTTEEPGCAPARSGTAMRRHRCASVEGEAPVAQAPAEARSRGGHRRRSAGEAESFTAQDDCQPRCPREDGRPRRRFQSGDHDGLAQAHQAGRSKAHLASNDEDRMTATCTSTTADSNSTSSRRPGHSRLQPAEAHPGSLKRRGSENRLEEKQP